MWYRESASAVEGNDFWLYEENSNTASAPVSHLEHALMQSGLKKDDHDPHIVAAPTHGKINELFQEFETQSKATLNTNHDHSNIHSFILRLQN